MSVAFLDFSHRFAVQIMRGREMIQPPSQNTWSWAVSRSSLPVALVRRHFGIVVSFLSNLSDWTHIAVILGSDLHLWPRLSPWVYFSISCWLWITLSQSSVCNPYGASCQSFSQTPAPISLSHLLPELFSDLSAAFSLSLAGTPEEDGVLQSPLHGVTAQLCLTSYTASSS